MWEAVAVQKLLSFFQQKISAYLVIYKVLKHLTSWPLNELVKLTMLWTTGPRQISHIIFFTLSDKLTSLGMSSDKSCGRHHLVYFISYIQSFSARVAGLDLFINGFLVASATPSVFSWFSWNFQEIASVDVSGSSFIRVMIEFCLPEIQQTLIILLIYIGDYFYDNFV